MALNTPLFLFCVLFCFTQSLGELIKGVGSGKCLSVPGANWQNGAKEVIWPCSPDGANFQWFAEKSPTQNGYFLKSQNVKKCFAVAGGSTADGAEIIQWDCADQPHFLWNFRQTASGHYQIVGLGSNKCAAVGGLSVADGANLVIWPCAETTNFLWDIGTGGGDPYSKLIDDFPGELIKGVGSGKCLSVPGANWQNGADEVIATCGPDAANFKWIVEKSPTQDGYYLKSMNVKKCFAVGGASVADGAKIVQWDCADAPNYLWNFKQVGNGYQIIGLGSNKCAAVSGGSVADNAAVVLWPCADAGNFLWDVGNLAASFSGGSSNSVQENQGGIGTVTYVYTTSA